MLKGYKGYKHIYSIRKSGRWPLRPETIKGKLSKELLNLVEPFSDLAYI